MWLDVGIVSKSSVSGFSLASNNLSLNVDLSLIRDGSRILRKRGPVTEIGTVAQF